MTMVDMDIPFGLNRPTLPCLWKGVVHAIKCELQHRYMQVEAMAELAAAGVGEPKQIPCAA